MQFWPAFALRPTASPASQRAFRGHSGKIVGKWPFTSGAFAACLLWAGTRVGRNAIRALFCTASHESVGHNAILTCSRTASHGIVGRNAVMGRFRVSSHGFAGITARVQGMIRRNRWKMAAFEWRHRGIPAVGRHASGTQRDSGLFMHCVPRNSGTEHTIATYAHCVPRRHPHHSMHSVNVQAKSLENGGL